MRQERFVQSFKSTLDLLLWELEGGASTGLRRMY